MLKTCGVTKQNRTIAILMSMMSADKKCMAHTEELIYTISAYFEILVQQTKVELSHSLATTMTTPSTTSLTRLWWHSEDMNKENAP